MENKAQKSKEEFTPGEAAKSVISLSQAVLAPLDAIFKAQTHAARSFLNMVLQIGFPHLPVDEKGNLSEETLSLKKTKYNTVFQQEFYCQSIIEGKPVIHKIVMPALALVPITPLAVEAAEFSFDMAVSHVDRYEQLQESRVKLDKYDPQRRPWFLVRDPIDIRGVIAPKSAVQQETETQAKIHIQIKVGPGKMPEGMDRLLTTLTQAGTFTTEPSLKNSGPNQDEK